MVTQNYHFVRALDANGNPTGPTTTIYGFSQNGQTSNIWGMASDAELQPGEYAMNGLASEQADEVFTLVPESRNPTLNLQFSDARMALRNFEARIAKGTLAA